MPKLIHRYSSNKSLALKLLVLLTLVLSNLYNSALAQERVYTYSSIIKVLPNRSLDVTETITVNVENRKIRHGIYRDFETSRVNQDNEKVTVDLKIIGVKRNGVVENYHTRQQGNKIRVFFGSKDKIVTKGIQTYIFHYVTNNQLNSYQDKDEFYWNASGNKWSMPIFRVEATIVLPPGVKKKQITFNAYSGYTGVNKQDYISSFSNNHTVKFALNKKYLAGNGLTIAIAWPKGLIQPANSSKPKPQVAITKDEVDNIVVSEKSVPAKTPLKNETAILPILKVAEQEAIIQQEVSSKNKPDKVVKNEQQVTQISKPEEILVNKSEASVKSASINFLNDFNLLLIEKTANLTQSNLIALTSLVLLLIYFLTIRIILKKKSDSSNKSSSEESENIPENLSPAAIRYIYEMGYDDRTFAIALINIAVKGHIDIINTGNAYKIERRDFSAADKLSDDESLLLNSLMKDESVIKLTSKNHRVIRDAMTKHRNLLEKDHKDKYFSTNKKWFNIGIALISITVMATAYVENSFAEALILFTLASIFTFFTFIFSYLLLKLLNFYNNFDIEVISNSPYYASILESKEAYVFALVAIETGMISLLTNYLDPVSIFTISLAGFISAIFSDYLISPNTEGKNIINKIVHLKKFITHGEMLKANMHYDSIQISQQISAFDNYLPYTIALGVETQWGNHYSLLFNDNNNSDDAPGYSPHWYHGSGWKENNTTGFCESLSSNFSFSAASAAKSPEHNFDENNTLSFAKH